MSNTKMRTKRQPPTHHRRPSQEAFSSIRKLSTISEDTLTPLNEPFQDKTADLVLISSDGLGFKVHSSKLMRCSNIFRTTLKPSSLLTPPPSPGSGVENILDIPEIHFTQSQVENGITLSLFLHLLYSVELPIPSLPIYFKAYETLVVFLKKWECTTLFDRLSQSMKGWVEEGYISSSKGFKIGDLLKNDGLLIESIKRSGECTWSGRIIEDPYQKGKKGNKGIENPAETSEFPKSPLNPAKTQKSPQVKPEFDILRDGLPGESSLDLTAVPYEYFISLSDEVKFALLRASRVGVTRVKEEMDWEKVGIEFEHVLNELRQAK